MDPDLEALYTVIRAQKQSLIDKWAKIDDCVQRANQQYNATPPNLKPQTKRDFMIELINILRACGDMIFITETVVGDFESKLKQSSSGNNPFLLTIGPAEPAQDQVSYEQLFSDDIIDLAPVVDNTPTIEIQEVQRSSGNTPDLICDGSRLHEIEKQPVRQRQRVTEKAKQMVLDHLSVKGEPACSVDTKPSSALEKLNGMEVRDRVAEYSKQFEWKVIPDDVRLVPGPKVQNVDAEQQQRKKKAPKHFEPVDVGIKLEGMQCYFLHIKSPEEFYLRILNEEYQEVHRDWNDYLNKKYDNFASGYGSKDKAREALGNFCFVRVDHSWKRAETQWMMNFASDVSVYLSDEGKYMRMPYENLRPMRGKFAEYPRFALRCHLYHVRPPSDRAIWESGHVEHFTRLSGVNEESVKLFTIIFDHLEGNSYGVELFDLSNEVTLGETFSKYLLDDIFIPDEDLEDPETMNEALTGYDAKDEARICQFTDKSGGCFKGVRCKLDHTPLAPDGITTDKQLIYDQSPNKLVLPCEGQAVNIKVTAQIDICHFYGQIVGANKSNREFDRLCALIERSNVGKTRPKMNLWPAHGEVVLLRHEDKWYRGVCRGQSGDFCEVFLVDLGFVFWKKVGELRQITEDFLHCPFQAVEIILEGFMEKPGINKDWSDKLFMDIFYFQTFKSVIRGRTGSAIILVDLFDNNGHNMGTILQDIYKVACKRKEVLMPPKDCRLQLS